MWDKPSSFSLSSSNLRLCPIQHFLKLCDPVSHARVHVGFRTLDVVMEIVAKELNVRDGGGRDGRIGEMARKENKSDIADVFCVSETGKMANFQGRVAIGV